MATSNSVSLDQVSSLRDQLLNRHSGKWLLHQQHPDEFEYYMCAIELLDSNLSTKEYFIFPIMPSGINYNNTSLTKITKTAGGVSVLKNSQFVPKNLSINGTFGRSFKILLGNNYQDLVSNFSAKNIKETIKTGGKRFVENFNKSVKSGYACTKLLETILNQSNQKDDLGKNHYMIFYNLAFNQSFFVEFEDETYSMTQESNMIWQYSFKLKAIAPSNNYLKTKKDDLQTNKQLVVNNLIQKKTNAIYNETTSILNRAIPSFI
jgi:hypothetical protein